MSREKTYNFSAGPSVLPVEALETAAAEMLDYTDSYNSVMEAIINLKQQELNNIAIYKMMYLITGVQV